MAPLVKLPAFSFFILLSALAHPGYAAETGAPLLSSPIACEVGKDCFVQNYVDTDSSSEARDYECGSLTYDGHKGTDIRLRNYVEMDKGVDVLAAAPGVVLRLRDEMDDVSVREVGIEAIKDREAGNSVIVDHGDGWVTQYAHMKLGSIVVKPGDTIEAGTKLGQVGLSGMTEFPHLHFELRHNDEIIDPYTGADMSAGCDLAPVPLWKPEIAWQFAYVPTGLLGSGFALGKPDLEAAQHGAYAEINATSESPALVFWIEVFGLQSGDTLTLTLNAPNGSQIVHNAIQLDRSKAQYFAFVGEKRPEQGWEPGDYTGTFEVVRGGQSALKGSAALTIK